MNEKRYPEKGIWSKNYGEQWENAYLAGNGVVGAMVYGDPSSTHVIGNHHDFFLKGNNMTDLPDTGQQVQQLRKIIQEEGYEKGVKFFEEEAIKEGYQGLTMSDPYHPAVELIISLTNKNDQTIQAGSFTRMLDYEKGIVEETHYTNENTKIQKVLFVSRKTNAIHMRYTASHPVDCSLEVVDFQEEKLKQQTEWESDQCTQNNQYIDGTGYQTTSAFHTDGKQVQLENQLQLQQMTFIEVTIGINQPVKYQPFAEQLNEHIQLHSELFNQVSFDLVPSQERQRSIESLLEEMK